MSEEKHEYTAAILIIGDEILSGRTIDSNTPWLAERLNQQGIRLAEVRILQDIEDDIITAVNSIRHQYDYIFTTGGIGPTHDDITTESIAKAFSLEIEENVTARKMLENHYNTTDLNDARLKMAMIPKGAKLINNPVSGAAGFQIENVYIMAGVPRIMQAMTEGFIGTLAGGSPMLSNTVSCDLSEGQIADNLGKLQKQYPNVSIGSYPQYRSGDFSLSVSLRSTDIKMLEHVTSEVIKSIDILGGKAKAVNIRPCCEQSKATK